MPRKPTIADLARASGLGPATVDRVLNARANVSPRAKARVAMAAEELGYPLPPALRTFSETTRAVLDLGFVLHKKGQAFYQQFAAEIEKTCAARSDVTIRPQIRFAASQSPGDFESEIRSAADTCQAVAATAVNHASLTRLAEELTRNGTPIYALLNDFGGRSGAGYFGMDNMKVGRL
ncbi:MAG: LacI family DNA-binding transcriptional regulator, partial [Marivivens sp.]|nr:LacI family DNA-binding transcriptional regulator [Marivivens sp.]